MICQNCKAEISGNPKFCPKCGVTMDATVVPATTPGSGAAQATAAVPAALSSNSAARQDSVICPKCGTPNPPTARFCKKDGVPLQGGAAAQQPAAPEVTRQPAPQRAAPRVEPAFAPERPPARRSWKTLVTAGVAAFVVLASALGGYLYWAGHIGDRQGSVMASVNTELGKKSLSNVKISSIAKDWKTVAEGMAASQAEKDQALALIKKHGQLKLIDNIRVKPSRADMEQQLNKELANAGMKQVTAQLDEGFTTVTLKDAELSPEDRDKAEKLVTSATMAAAGVADVKVVHAAPVQQTVVASPAISAQPAVDVAQLENGLNEQLRGAGLGTVSASVDANGTANLQGAVATREEKDRAIKLALSLPGIAGVGDSIRVAPPAASAAPARLAPPTSPQATMPAPAPAAARDPTKLEGEINRALRNGGAGGVTAQVSDDFSVTLKGSATSAAQKDRAFQIARQFKGAGVVKDRIFVVEQ